MNRILLFALLLTAATMAQATPVLRELHPRIQAGDGCDLDGDGVKDVTFRSYEPAHVAMGYFSFDWASVVPREGFEFLMVGSSPQQVSRVAGVKAPLTCGPTPSQGAWSQVVPEPEIGLVLGGRTHSWPQFTGDPITSYGGIVAETRTPYVGFRLKRGGQTFYGVLDAHRYPEPPVTNPPATGNDTLVITAPPPTSIVSFGAVIMETQPDTPVVIDDPRLALRDQGGATVANGSTSDFGTTDLGGFATRTFTLTNDGTATLRDLAVSVTGINARDFALTTPAVTSLPPGESTTVLVTFVPGTAGASSAAELVIASNDPEARQFVVKLKAQAGAAKVPLRVEEVGGSVVTPLSAPIDFGSPMLGATVSKSFRVTNMGTAPLLNLQASVDEPLGPLHLWGEPSYPPGVEHALIFKWLPWFGRTQSGFNVMNSATAILLPGESATVSVRWSPYETQSKTRTLLFTGSNAVSANVTITGAATPYIYKAPKLAGLHYRFGDSADWLPQSQADAARSTLATTSCIYPDISSLTPEIASRWTDWVPSDQSYEKPHLDSRWLANRLFYLEPTSGAGWVFSDTSGANSAWSKMGSQVALSADVAPGRFLRSRSVPLKLSAQDRVGMELWLKPVWVNDQPVQGAQCVSFVGQTNDAGFGLWLIDGALQGRAGVSRVTMPLALSADWHHVALLLEGGRLSLRVDGVESLFVTEASLPGPVHSLTVGAAFDGWNPARVNVDELRLFELADDFDPASDLLLTAKPKSQVDKAIVDFGDVPLKTMPVQSCHLTNTGPGWLRILSASISGEAAAEYRYQGTQGEPLQPDRPADPNYLGGLASISLISLPPFSFSPSSNGTVWSGDSRMVAALAPDASMTINVLHLPGASGSRDATLTLTTDDPAHPTWEIPLHSNATPALPPRLTLPVKEWSWGTLLMSESRSLDLYPTNSGGEPLTQLRAEIVGPHASDYTLKTSWLNESTLVNSRQYRFGVAPPSPITAGAVILPPQISITVQPSAEGIRLAWLRIHSNDPAQPVIDVPLYGRAAVPKPQMQVKGQLYYPDSLAQGETVLVSHGVMDFGSLRRTSEMSAGYVRTHSVGNSTLTISSVTISGPNASDFVLDVAGVGSMNPGQFGSSTVKFQPSSEGFRAATLRIESNDPDQPVVEIVLTGRLLPGTPEMMFDPGGGMNSTSLANAFLRVGTAVVKPFRRAGAAPVTKVLRVKNTGTAAFRNAQVSFTGEAAADFSATINGSIDPDATCEITVTFDPSLIGARAAVMHVVGEGSSFDVPVAGTGAYGQKASLNPQLPAGWVTTAMAEYEHQSLLIAGYAGEGAARKYSLCIVDRAGQLLCSIITTNGAIRSIARLGHKVCFAGEFTLIYGLGKPFNSLSVVEHWAGWTPPPRPDANCRGAALWTAPSVPEPVGIVEGIPASLELLTLEDLTLPVTGDFIGRAVLALPDGKILVGGSGSLGGRKNLIRLNADRTLDTTFTLPEPDGPVNALALQDDGKVLVGGEFTNLGQVYVPGPLPQLDMVDYSRSIIIGRLKGPLAAGSEGGLCRLNTDGTNDTTFGNPGFHGVTALAVRGDRIAVGGVEIYNPAYILHAGLYGPSPQPGPPFEVNAVRLLTLSGQTLARTDMQQTPRVVALQPNQRLYVAPGNVQSWPLPLSPGVGLIQPLGADPDYWGVAAQVPANPPINDGTSPPPNFYYRIQKLDGEINALLPQADGRMLVGGALTKARIGSVFIGPEPTNALPPSPNEVPLNGLVQLDSEGFARLPAPPGSRLNYFSDGFTKLGFAAATDPDPPSFTGGSSEVLNTDKYDALPGVTIPVGSSSNGRSLSIEGPDADKFVIVGPYRPGVAYFAEPDFVTLHCIAPGAGVYRAVLQVRRLDFDDSFDIALEATGTAGLSSAITVTTDGNATPLTSATTVDFGITNEGTTVQRSFTMANRGSTSTAPISVAITGADAADFTFTPLASSTIAANSSTGFVVSFTPRSQLNSGRTAALTITDGSVGLPFVIQLTGTGVPPLTSSGINPLIKRDLVLVKGETLSLSRTISVGRPPFTWQWYHNGTAIRGAQDQFFTIDAVASYHAGTYSVVVANAFGHTGQNDAASVAIIGMEPKTLGVLNGKSLKLECQVSAREAVSFAWMRNGTPLSGSDYIGINTATLTIKKASAALTGSYTCKVSLRNASAASPPIMVALIVPPTISTGFTTTTWRVAQPVDDRITASSLIPVSFVAQGVPPGLSFNMKTGAITGKPAKAGNYKMRFQAWNAQGHSAVFEQTVTVLPWAPGFVGSFHGAVMVGSGASVGQWTLTAAANGTFTAKVLEASPDTEAGTNAQRQKLFGGLTSTAFSGSLIFVPESDHISHAAASLVRGPTEVFDLVITITDNTAHAQFTRHVGFGDQAWITSGEAAPVLSKVAPRFVGSYASGTATYRGSPAGAVPTLNLTFTIGATGTSNWVSRIRADFGARVLTGSAPVINDGSNAPYCEWFGVMPDTAVSRVVTGQASVADLTAAKPEFSGSFGWWDGPVDNPVPVRDQAFDFQATKVK